MFDIINSDILRKYTAYLNTNKNAEYIRYNLILLLHVLYDTFLHCFIEFYYLYSF